MQGISWKCAYVGSDIIHLVIARGLDVFLACTVLHQEEQKMYVVDLDIGELTSSGSGGSSLFPEKLSEQDVVEKTAQVQVGQSVVAPLLQTPAPSPISGAVSTAESANTAVRAFCKMQLSKRYMQSARILMRPVRQ